MVIPKRKETLGSLKAEIKRLKTLVSKDELTGLYNRRGLLGETEKFLRELALHHQQRDKRKSFFIKNFAIALFDIDNFKKLNDTYGHQAGDRALIFVAKTIMDRAREVDIAGRWGGEELVLGLVGANEKDAFEVAEHIRSRIADQPFKWGARRLRITVSAGVAAADDKNDFQKLFAAADQALYAAKKAGKNCVIRYSEVKKKG